ncbi:MAG TPA: hypothetical protein VLX92_18795 [Kofleriaceae bacterium]|nr:hypothetical protein [Kofleriaceae bacterium]
MLLWLVAIGCGGHPGAGPDAAPPADAAPDAPPLVSSLPSCSATSDPCAQADLAASGHVISPAIFGDGIEWDNDGQDVLEPDPTGQTPGTLRPDVMTALAAAQLTVMRYPGGTLADMFHWQQAVGPMASRTPQVTFSGSELPAFGPDEFASFAHQLGSDILLTVNVATGTPDEAAGWIAHWKAAGVSVKYVEVGNETYLGGPDFQALDPVSYAQRFDAYAQAIRAVDPAIQVGAIGTLDTSSWCYPNCATHPWNEQVLLNTTQKADFFAVHNSYAPGTDQDGQAVYEAMLSDPTFMALDNTLIAGDIDRFGNAQTKGAPIAITEHASYFLAPDGADLDTIRSDIGRNQTWAAALYSALVFDRYLADARVQLVTHINPLSYIWQAPVGVTDPTLATDLQHYDARPTVSPYGLVFAAYRALAAATDVPATVTSSPTIDTAAIGFVPALTATPLVDAIAARGASASWMFVVNRSLTTDLTVGIVLTDLPAGATTLAVDELSGDYLGKNLPGMPPQVGWTTVLSGALPADHGAFGTTISVPKATLVRVRVQ